MAEAVFQDEIEACTVCGCDLEWADCWSCVGDGGYHDCGEDCCCCANPDDDLNCACDVCDGRGGWPLCPLANSHPPAPQSSAENEKSGGGTP